MFVYWWCLYIIYIVPCRTCALTQHNTPCTRSAFVSYPRRPRGHWAYTYMRNRRTPVDRRLVNNTPNVWVVFRIIWSQYTVNNILLSVHLPYFIAYYCDKFSYLTCTCTRNWDHRFAYTCRCSYTASGRTGRTPTRSFCPCNQDRKYT